MDFFSYVTRVQNAMRCLLCRHKSDLMFTDDSGFQACPRINSLLFSLSHVESKHSKQFVWQGFNRASLKKKLQTQGFKEFVQSVIGGVTRTRQKQLIRKEIENKKKKKENRCDTQRLWRESDREGGFGTSKQIIGGFQFHTFFWNEHLISPGLASCWDHSRRLITQPELEIFRLWNSTVRRPGSGVLVSKMRTMSLRLWHSENAF